jgi:flagellar motor switch protein FliM
LTTQDWVSYKKKGSQDESRNSLLENIGDAKLKMRAYLAQTSIKVRDLISLEVGDVLKTQKEAGEDLILKIENRSKFAGKVGQFRGNRAFKITRQAKPEEKI